MSLQLPSAPPTYSREDQANLRLLVQNFSRETLKRGDDIDAGRVILTAPNGSQFILGVDNTGALTTTPR